jgi:oligopeptide/dipeptide ABC transporter ATP-binding protein
MSAVLTITDAVKHYAVRGSNPFAKPAIVHALDGVSVEVPHGETLGIVGESGCGKSTLGRLITGLVAPTSGTVRIVPREPGTAPVQMVFQDPASALDPRMTVLQSIAEPLAGVPRAERDRRIREMTETVGLAPELLERYPHELSGGQQQRVCIARALVARPAVVLLDEAVSALDASLQAAVLQLLRRLQEESGVAYVFISHDLRAVREISDRIAVMYLGQVVESAPAEAFDRGLLHPYSVALRSAEPRLAGAHGDPIQRIVLTGEPPSAVNPPTGCRFAPRCPIARERCRTEAPELREAGDGHRVSCHFPGELRLTGTAAAA